MKTYKNIFSRYFCSLFYLPVQMKQLILSKIYLERSRSKLKLSAVKRRPSFYTIQTEIFRKSSPIIFVEDIFMTMVDW
jgi:hypothetical protein